jgi:hypothetical protein
LLAMVSAELLKWLSRGRVMLSGHTCMCTGPIATDFGEHDGRSAQATVAGILNGVACYVSCLGPLLGRSATQPP